MIKVGITGGRVTASAVCIIAALKTIYPLVEVYRTRRFDKYNDLNLVFGGGVHDGQSKFDPLVAPTERRANGKELRLLGLFWKAFGESVCYSLLKHVKSDTSEDLDPKKLELIPELIRMIDQQFIAGIDDEDGICRPENLIRSTSVPAEEERPIRRSFSELIAAFNPVQFTEDTSPQVYDRSYSLAVEFAQQALLNIVRHCIGKLEADAFVTASDNGQPILTLAQPFSWFDAVRRLPHVSLVVYPDPNAERNFRVESPLVDKGSAVRKPIPAAWVAASLAKEQEKLIELTGVEDVVMADFRGRWISARSEAGAHTLAQKILAVA